MYLKALEIQGFKSFPDKIKLDMPRGLTAVVGPNGSGKSNVSDSIKWVLGEQSSKSLRGEKMEDVIFSGTKQRKPLGFAEVSIIIDNEFRNFDIDTDDIKITRKYFRSGESEYRINGQNVRLKDVHELFMDTGLGRDGYSIIGQGKIDEIVNSKGTERRVIFEEAAGISKFRYRKEQAERKLDQAEENLLRLRDILTELENRVEPLRIQSEKANEFLELSEKKREIEISLWLQKIDILKVEIRSQENKIYISKNQYKEIEEQLNIIENQIGETYLKVENKLKEIEEKRGEKKVLEDEISLTSSKIAVLNNDIFHNNEQEKRINNDIILTTESVENAQSVLDDNENQKQKILDEISNNENNLTDFVSALNELNTKNTDFSDSITEITQKINLLTSSLSNAKVEIASFDTTKNEILNRQKIINDEIIEKENYFEGIDNQFTQISDFILILNDKKSENINAIAGYNEILEIKEKKFQVANSDLNSMSIETEKSKNKAKILSDMEKNMEGFSYAVKFILNRVSQGMLSGIYGPLFKLIKAKPEFTVAIETALGAGMQNIVCENENDAKQAIYALKKADSGRATFLPVNTIKGSKLDTFQLEKCEGFLGLACDLLDFDSKFSGIICSLLGRIVIVDEFDNAVIIAKKFGYKFRVVTKDGQVVNTGGSLTGGSNSKKSGLLSRQAEIESLNLSSVQMLKKIEDGKKSLVPLIEEIAKLKAVIIALKSEGITLNEDLIKCEAEIKRFDSNKNEIIQSLEKLKSEKTNSESRINNLYIKNEEFKKSAEIDEKKIIELENRAEQITGTRQDVKTRRNELFSEISDIKIVILGKKKDLENIESTKQLILEQKQTHSQKIETLNSLIENLKIQNKKIADEIEKIRLTSEESLKIVDEYELSIKNLMQERLAIEGEVSIFRKSEKELMGKKEDVSRELIRLEEQKNSMVTESDNLIVGLLDEYELSLTMAYELQRPIDDIQKAQKEVNLIKNKIRNLGSVNVSAIEEFKEVNERYLFLKAQIEDVENSKKQLTDLINELSSSMKTVFSNKFEKINENFINIFRSLFGGGNAMLKLTDKNDVLNAGIEIKVEPPGKVINNISSLSGGEIALVAISIYFAILKVNPSPFCVLDEIDAALDDVNVNKLAAYLKTLNDKTQFISITHKRGTMEEADVLYGVTMQEKGVSKLLKLDVSEVEEKLGIQTK